MKWSVVLVCLPLPVCTHGSGFRSVSNVSLYAVFVSVVVGAVVTQATAKGGFRMKLEGSSDDSDSDSEGSSGSDSDSRWVAG